MEINYLNSNLRDLKKFCYQKSIMQVYTNFDESCHEMFNMLKMDQKILKEIHGSQKYLK